MTGEANIDSIRALEERIREHRHPIIELKRTQNSLLNISRLPPEVLGDIFCQNVIPEEAFGGFAWRSHNFLLVCRHWFEVASRTPDIWSFWGNNLQDWAKRCLRYPAASADLVLDGVQFPEDSLDETLRKALQDRAAADTIRRVHLLSKDPGLLSDLIAPLTADCEGIQSSSAESIVIRSEHGPRDLAVEVSDFFAHYRFPKLRNLDLKNCTITSWDLIASRTSVLTDLDLYFEYLTPGPTTAQLMSIFSSNPGLRTVRLSGYSAPIGAENLPSVRVPLHNLEYIDFSGDFQDTIGLLHRLDARNADIILSLHGGVIEDIPRILGPYLRTYLLHHRSSRNGLAFYVSRVGQHVTLCMGDGGEIRPELKRILLVFISLPQSLPENLQRKAVLDLIADTP